jgi:DNA-binding transcriptional ArsR family regulator
VTTEVKQAVGINESLIKALNHPFRVRALTILTERTASPKELGLALGESVNFASYHIRALADLGLLELVRTEPRRGAVEHYYRASVRVLLDNDGWEQLSPMLREAISGIAIGLIISDANEAFEERTLDARLDRHLTRTPLVLDEVGWQKANGVLNAALEELLKVQAESAGRMTSDDQPIRVSASMLCFELPRTNA